jgi:hypothetical protein
MFLRFLDSILPGSGAIIKATIRAVERGVASFVESFKNDWIRYTQSEGQQSRPSTDVRHDIHETDGEISDLERKDRRDGGLSQGDKERLEELRRQAMDLGEEHQQARSQETTEEILADSESPRRLISVIAFSYSEHVKIHFSFQFSGISLLPSIVY